MGVEGQRSHGSLVRVRDVSSPLDVDYLWAQLPLLARSSSGHLADIAKEALER